MTESFTNYICWTVDRVPDVINREAVEMASAAFMATHTPITGLHYEISEYAIEDSSEIGLLNILIQRSERDLHSFIVLKGAPGAGKSHLTRWLKERFETHQQQQGHQEAVLLIRRANSSLRSTINQIIEAQVFDSPIFSSYVQRLREAGMRLTGEEMLNRILNGLQEAALAVRQGTYQLPSGKHFSRRITENMPEFLQNQTVRTQLARDRASLGRIAAFLTGEDRITGEGEEMPQFNAQDFQFPDAALRELRQTQYEEVKSLAQLLTTQSAAVSEYLNSLLNRAVANLTSLTPDQLREMFGELRRQLRREGKNLTLFIEDITAFTGLDIALLDVLIAQHGAENPEYCRLTSLVGVTDHYFDEYFQDNIRQRVTFLISMNAMDQNEQVSQLLRSPTAVAEMASRYLNAIRLERGELEEWYATGAVPESMPIACNRCPVRKTCHDTFGAVQTGMDSTTRVGLYPFNQRALWNLYSNLDVAVVGRTPRSLINNILAYIIVSHTDSLRHGQFPRPPMDLVDNVTPPLLKKPAQRMLINKHAANRLESERIESLVRVWGDGTIDTAEHSGYVTVGDLPESAFRAFGLPIVRGDIADPVAGKPELIPANQTPIAPVDVVTGPSPYAADIEGWRTGERLIAYRDLAQELAGFIKSTIEWDLYGISRTLVDERITQARLEIEGQDGLAKQRPRYLIPRSDAFALVLHAIDELRSSRYDSPEQVATNTALLHSWLEMAKSSLIDYVAGSGVDQGATLLDYATMVVEGTCAVAVLTGDMIPSETTSRELYLRLVAFAKRSIAMTSALASAESRSDHWKGTLKGLRDTDKLRAEFLTLLNCPQGVSSSIVYLDAARAIDILGGFRRKRLCPSVVNFAETKSPSWGVVQSIHQRLAEYMPKALADEVDSLDMLVREIEAMCAPDGIGATFDALVKFARFAEEVRFEFPRPDDLTARKLSNRLDDIAKVTGLEGDSLEKVLRLSAILKSKREMVQYVDYFQQLSNRMDRITQRIQEELVGRESEVVTARKNEILSVLRLLQLDAEQLSTGGAS